MTHVSVIAIETSCHEMSATVFLQQMTFVHANAGRCSHEVVRVFDAAVVLRGAELKVPSHPVKLEQPVFEAFRYLELAGESLFRLAITREVRLGASLLQACELSTLSTHVLRNQRKAETLPKTVACGKYQTSE